jgi:hypothetical protein
VKRRLKLWPYLPFIQTRCLSTGSIRGTVPPICPSSNCCYTLSIVAIIRYRRAIRSERRSGSVQSTERRVLRILSCSASCVCRPAWCQVSDTRRLSADLPGSCCSVVLRPKSNGARLCMRACYLLAHVTCPYTLHYITLQCSLQTQAIE